MDFLFPSERGRERENPTPSLFKSYVSLLLCRMSQEQFYTMLFPPVKPGMWAGLNPVESRKQLRMNLISCS